MKAYRMLAGLTGTLTGVFWGCLAGARRPGEQRRRSAGPAKMKHPCGGDRYGLFGLVLWIGLLLCMGCNKARVGDLFGPREAGVDASLAQPTDGGESPEAGGLRDAQPPLWADAIADAQPAVDAGAGDREPDVTAPEEAGVGEVEAGNEPPPAITEACSAQLLEPSSSVAFPDDLDSDCSNGIQTSVALSTDAADETEVTLRVAGVRKYTALVMAGRVEFPEVSLPLGDVTLTADVAAAVECALEVDLTVECGVAPSCAIAVPEAGALNGVSVNQGGDRVSPPGVPYQTEVSVETDLPEGGQVSLIIDGQEGDVRTTVQGGVAAFPAVTLGAEGQHTLQAACSLAGVSDGLSEVVNVTVDSLPPEIALLPPLDVSGHHYSPPDDADPTTEVLDFDVCVETDARGTDNVCVGIGTVAPTCTSSSVGGVAAGIDGGCVRLSCPGTAAFDLAISVRDAAGNEATDRVAAVTCTSETPSVVVANILDGTQNPSDVTRHILAAGAEQGLPDADPTAAGAQQDIVACTDAAAGDAQVYLGFSGSLSPIGDPQPVVPAVAGDGCGNLGFVARFSNVRFPESLENGGELVALSQLRVDVTDGSGETGSSPTLGVWVDSIPPTLSVVLPPGGLCGTALRQQGSYTTDVQFGASSFPVVARLNGAPAQGVSFADQPGQFGVSETKTLVFAPGTTLFTAEVTEPSGNRATLLPAPCEVLVQEPHSVAWVQPLNGATLGYSTDENATLAGWQGALSVNVTGFDASALDRDVTFYYQLSGQNPVEIGSAPIVGDSSGATATVSGTIAEGSPVTLIAIMDPVDGFVAQAPSIVVQVDVTPPPPPAEGVLTAVEVERRGASYQLEWTGVDDAGGTLADYEVFWSTAPISEATLTDAVEVDFDGVLAADPAGMVVSHLPLERDLYFAVRAVNTGDGRGTLVTTADAVRSNFNITVLSGPSAASLGAWVDGTADIIGGRQDPTTMQWLQGDGTPDLLVGSWSESVFVYRGLPRSGPDDTSPLFSQTPSIVISATEAGRFGNRVAAVGDINNDGLTDFAIGGSYRGTGFQGSVVVFYGRQPTDNSGAEWPATLDEADADLVVQTPGGADWGAGDCDTCTEFGASVIPVGDFNGDDIDDLAITAPRVGDDPLDAGFVAIVLGSESLPALIEMSASPYDEPPSGVLTILGPHPGGRLGYGGVGMGPYYGAGGNGLLVAATHTERLFTYTQGQIGADAGSVGILSGSKDAYNLGLSRNDYGVVVAALGGGRFAASSPCDEAFFLCAVSEPGFVDLFFGSSNPFSELLRLTNTDSDFDFGMSVMGSAVTTTTGLRPLPLIGDAGQADSDFAIVTTGVTQASPNTGPVLYLFPGELVDEWIYGAMASPEPVDIAAVGNSWVTLDLATKPDFDFTAAPWSGTAPLNLPAADMNGDGFAEIIIAEFGHYPDLDWTFDYDGRVVVLW